MREYKFRGQKYNGEWAYGSYHYCNQPGQLGKIKYTGGVEYKDVEFNSHWILVHQTPDTVGWSERDTYTPYSVNPETVGQFTGLKDKNGKEIYEGDIIRFQEIDSTVVVRWFDGNCCYGGFIEGICKNDLTPYFVTPYEVIGNIYETPELIPVNE